MNQNEGPASCAGGLSISGRYDFYHHIPRQGRRDARGAHRCGEPRRVRGRVPQIGDCTHEDCRGGQKRQECPPEERTVASRRCWGKRQTYNSKVGGRHRVDCRSSCGRLMVVDGGARGRTATLGETQGSKAREDGREACPPNGGETAEAARAAEGGTTEGRAQRHAHVGTPASQDLPRRARRSALRGRHESARSVAPAPLRKAAGTRPAQRPRVQDAT